MHNVAAREEKLLRNNIKVDIQEDLSSSSVTAPIDKTARSLMQKHGLAGVPLTTPGDGSCLFHAASIALVGDCSLSTELRYKTALTMVLHSKDVSEQHTCPDSMDIVSPSYKFAAESCSKLSEFSSTWTIMALSLVINRPIKSVYPPENGPTDKVCGILNTTFAHRDRKDNDAMQQICIMWTSMSLRERGTGTWTPNHFVPIVPAVREEDYGDDAGDDDGGDDHVADCGDDCHGVICDDVDSVDDDVGGDDCHGVICDDVDSVDDDVGGEDNHGVGSGDNGGDDDHGVGDCNDVGNVDDDVGGDDDHGVIICNDDSVDDDDCGDDEDGVDSYATDDEARLQHDAAADDCGDGYHGIICDDVDSVDDDDVDTSAAADVADDTNAAQLQHGEQVPSQAKDLPRGQFLDMETLFKLLIGTDTADIDLVPDGKKNNVYFVVNNAENLEKRKRGKSSNFYDDRGAWQKGPSSKSIFVKENGDMKKVVKKKEKFCFERMKEKKRIYIPLEPQPAPQDVFVLQRYYVKHTLDSNYEKSFMADQ